MKHLHRLVIEPDEETPDIVFPIEAVDLLLNTAYRNGAGIGKAFLALDEGDNLVVQWEGTY